jgi:thiamine-monophosphate kinase
MQDALRIRPHQGILPAPPPSGRAVLGIGDDCALLAPTPGMQTGDFVRHAGRGPPLLCRRRCRASATSAWRSTCRTWRRWARAPRLHAGAGAAVRRARLAGRLFARGLFALADAFGCELVGGDTTKGPLNICITVFGELRAGRRCGATRPAPATISGFPAPWATPAWRWPATGWNERSAGRGQPAAAAPHAHAGAARGWACCWPNRDWRTRPSISRTAWSATSATSWRRSQVGATLDVDALPAGAVLARAATALRRALHGRRRRRLRTVLHRAGLGARGDPGGGRAWRRR